MFLIIDPPFACKQSPLDSAPAEALLPSQSAASAENLLTPTLLSCTYRRKNSEKVLDLFKFLFFLLDLPGVSDHAELIILHESPHMTGKLPNVINGC